MRIAAIICFVLSLAPIGVWVAQGGGMFTLEKRLVETTAVDDFGDEVTTEEWVEDFQLGLVDGALPVFAVLDTLGAFLFVIDLRRRRRGA